MRSLTIVVFFYDAFVTFDREVSCVWTAKWTGGSFLFIANKWISMLYYIVALVTSATFPSDKVSDYSPCYGGTYLTAPRGVCTSRVGSQCPASYRRMSTDIRSCSSFVMAQEAIQILQFFPGASKS